MKMVGNARFRSGADITEILGKGLLRTQTV